MESSALPGVLNKGDCAIVKGGGLQVIAMQVRDYRAMVFVKQLTPAMKQFSFKSHW